MRALGDERGSALITAIVVTATMLVLGTATIGIVLAQTDQTKKELTGESTFNLAEATLNAQAFLLARNWPQTPTAGTCSSTTLNGTLTSPGASDTSLRAQVQRMLAKTYAGDTSVASAQWWVTTCAEGARDSWDESLLNGPSYDTAPASSGPRRMWVRAEAHARGRKRAVVALVQAGQAPVFPSDFAVITGKMGADLGSALATLTNGPLLGGLLGLLIEQDPMFVGNVGLRCSLLDTTDLLGCVSGLLASPLMIGPLSSLLLANDYVHVTAPKVIATDQAAQLRQQAQASGTYYTSIAAGASCLPAASAGKVIFIEQVGDGTASCHLNTAPAGVAAKALVVGSGGIRVLGNKTFTGVLYALHAKTVAGSLADVRIENGSRVDGAVFVDDNPALGANSHGQVRVIVPPPNLCSALGLLSLACNLLSLNQLLSMLTLDALLPQLSPYLPAVTYNDNVVKAVTTLNDSAIVTGTFRQLKPMY
ncbi:MAG: hypothetical protein LC777_10790 [Actinobacteria bacterium]|nr:hypothetical protein [Actinomycetota bacterium]